MEWEPDDKLAVAYVAIPAITEAVPSVVVPSLNVTVPVATEGETGTVNVTGTLTVDGSRLEVSVVVVLVFVVPPPALLTALRALIRPQP
jgi:hypothetical protein